MGNGTMTDIRYVEPVKVLQHWLYDIASIRYNDGSSLVAGPFSTPIEPDCKQRILDLHHTLKELANRDLYDGKLPWCDNKEVYLFETAEEEKIAVLFKDGNAHFGKPSDLRALNGTTIRGVHYVIEVEEKLINCRWEVINEEPVKLAEAIESGTLF